MSTATDRWDDLNPLTPLLRALLWRFLFKNWTLRDARMAPEIGTGPRRPLSPMTTSMPEPIVTAADRRAFLKPLLTGVEATALALAEELHALSPSAMITMLADRASPGTAPHRLRWMSKGNKSVGMIESSGYQPIWQLMGEDMNAEAARGRVEQGLLVTLAHKVADCDCGGALLCKAGRIFLGAIDYQPQRLVRRQK